jgi:hypothetical protein
VFAANKKALHLRARLFHLSGWQDSNLRPSGPKPDALTGLRYTPKRRFDFSKRRRKYYFFYNKQKKVNLKN